MQKKLLSNISISILVSYVFLLNATYSFAVDTVTIENPLEGTNSLSAFFSSIVDVLIQLGVVISALGIMYGGFLLVTALGDEEKVANGRKTITWAVVGTAVLLGAKVIFVAIKGTVEQLN
jgi:hypothetical protein